jgi:subtilisin family serine protease
MKKTWSLLFALFLPTLCFAGTNTLFVRPSASKSPLFQVKATLAHTYEAAGWDQWEVPPRTDMLALIGELRAQGVEVWQDQRVEALVTPNDPIENTYQWHWLQDANKTGYPHGINGVDVNGHQAWDLWTGDSTFKIGMIDTGIQFTHEDLIANIWTNPGEIPGNGIDDDHNGYIDDVHGWDFGGETVTNDGTSIEDNDPADRYFHGTWTSSLVGGRGDNTIGVTGAMWKCELVPLKYSQGTTGGGWYNAIIRAMEYARTNGIKVTSNSYGGGEYFQPLADEIAACTASGMLTICAAGNSGLDCDCPMICSAYNNGQVFYPWRNYPADFSDPGIISVGASDPSDQVGSFSTFGPTSVDLFSPGAYIFGAYLYDPATCNNIICKYQSFNGTSGATPIVSGTAALIWSRYPSLTAAQVKSVILNSVEQKSAFTGKCVTGGRLDMYAAMVAAASVGGGGGGEQETQRAVERDPADPASRTMFSIAEARDLIHSGRLVFYDAAGRRVADPKPGIYFVNKRTVLVTR